MRGDLRDTGLEEIFAELSASSATGALHLEGTTGPAKVFFRDGDVYYGSSPAPRAQLGARLVGAGFIDDDDLDRALAAQDQGPARTKLGAILVDQGMVRRDVIRVFVQEQILDAVFDLARWDAGTFEFFRGDAVSEDLPVQIAAGPLLMEVRRRLSEWEDIRAVIPSLDAVPDFVRGGSTTQAALEPDEFTLLTSVDGRRSVRELAHDLGYSQFDAARLIYGLSLLGVIGVPNGEPDAATLERLPEEEPLPEVEAEGPPDDEPVDEEVEDVDVGRALDEALFGTPYEEEEEEAAAEPPREEPAVGPGRPTGDLHAGADDLEPEVWSASIDADETAAVEEPAAAAEPPPSVERTPPEPKAEPTRPEPPEQAPEPTEPAADESDQAREELLALVDELQGVPAGEDEEPEAVEVSDEAGAGEPAAPEEAPAPSQEPAERPAPSGRGDVSELLRELSRLAGGGPEPVAPSPDEPQSSDEPEDTDEAPEERQPPPEPEPQPDAKKDEDKRSTFRRLFGSR